jgi:NDP-sugar pyrophosphorylase family protein
MTLLVMAAGMGSRFGGVKQIAPVGQSGEIIIDYSIYDAIQAGFDNIVFVIRRNIETDFREIFFKRIRERVKGRAKVQYVFQEIPEWREKPLGTTDALLAAKNVINEPFCVINADDFYGRDAFQKVAKIKNGNAVVLYDLANTMSNFGSVTRGVAVMENGRVLDFVETSVDKHDIGKKFPMNTKVNVNFFLFTPEIFVHLEKIRAEFLKNLGRDMKAECLLPVNIGQLIKEDKIKLNALVCADRWLGLTYKEDLPSVSARIADLVSAKTYPSPLWA